jgi:hypothetical protein
MNTTFSFNRIGLLIKRYFAENKHRELSFWGSVIVVFMIMHQPTSIEIFFYISGFIFAARMFKIFSYTPGGMHYLLIPATHLEKLVTGILLSTVYFFIMLIITYSVGSILGTTLGNTIFGTNNPISLNLLQIDSISEVWGYKVKLMGNNVDIHNGILSIFFNFALIQSVFILGSVYFKKNAIGRTFLTVIFFTILIGLLEVLIFRLTFGQLSLVGQSFNMSISGDNLFPGFEQAGKIVKYVIIPFFWVVAYFRLTEKQV